MLLYAVELKSSAGQLVLLWAVELKSSAGQLVLLWAMCGAGAVVWSWLKLECFCRVWCIASLIGLSPILAVAVLRVNALSPLLTSLVGSSPALVLRVSWDGPTPFCFGSVFTYWSVFYIVPFSVLD